MNSTPTPALPKKAYEAPVLTEHGDLRSLTQAASKGCGETGNSGSKKAPSKC